MDIQPAPFGRCREFLCPYLKKKDFLRGVLNEDFLRGLSGPQIFERLAVFGMKVQVPLLVETLETSPAAGYEYYKYSTALGHFPLFGFEIGEAWRSLPLYLGCSAWRRKKNVEYAIFSLAPVIRLMVLALGALATQAWFLPAANYAETWAELLQVARLFL